MAWLSKGIDVAALLYAILFFPAPFLWLIVHPAIRFWRRFGARSLWIALPLWTSSGTFLVLLRHRIFDERVSRNALTAIAGVTLIGLAVWIGHHVHRRLGLKRLAGLPEVNPGRYPGGVVRAGIYARVRHPRYLEYMLTFLGLALLKRSFSTAEGRVFSPAKRGDRKNSLFCFFVPLYGGVQTPPFRRGLEQFSSNLVDGTALRPTCPRSQANWEPVAPWSEVCHA